MAGTTRSTPPGPPPTLKKSSSSSQSFKNQKSITGFFQKKPSSTSTSELGNLPPINGSKLPFSGKAATRGPSSSLTPAPSSDGPEEPQSYEKMPQQLNGTASANGLPSPITPASAVNDGEVHGSSHFNSPSRKVKSADDS